MNQHLSKAYTTPQMPVSVGFGLKKWNRHKCPSVRWIFQIRICCREEGNSTFVWCGTANGINKSTDAGLTWTKCNRTNSGICGNWATTLYRQHRTTQDFVWASTWMADFLEQSGLSFTTDNGTTWNARLIGKRPFDISSRDDTAYISTDGGLYRTTNGS